MAEESPRALTLEIECDADGTRVKCRGRLIIGTTEEFYAILQPLLPETKLLVVDLAELKYVDSMGIGALVRLYVSARKEGCELRLLNLSKQLHKLLSLTNLLSVFALSEKYGTNIG